MKNHSTPLEEKKQLKVLKGNTQAPILSIYNLSCLYIAQSVPHPLKLPSPESHFSLILATSFLYASEGRVVVSKEGNEVTHDHSPFSS